MDVLVWLLTGFLLGAVTVVGLAALIAGGDAEDARDLERGSGRRRRGGEDIVERIGANGPSR